MVFVDIGDQPALPLDRLEAMDAKALKELVKSLGKPAKASAASDDGEEDDAEADEDAAEEETESEHSDDEASEPEDAEVEDAPSDEQDEDPDHAQDDLRGAAEQRAHAWAVKAVEEGGLSASKGRKSNKPEALQARQAAVAALAKRLVARTVLPGEWYLVRFGGTRKGSGTYYTKPALAIPTVQRTLRPLCATPPTGADGTPDRDAAPERWTPRTPEEILALKVCDPACGSGSFLVAALRFLTEALEASLHHHGRYSRRPQAPEEA